MPDTRRHADEPAHEGGPDRRRDLIRALIVVLALIALVLTSSALNWVTEASAAEPGVPKRAVVIAGPVHSLTWRYRSYAKEIAAEAERQGMDVVRIFHPYAPPSKVKKQANGADLLVYVGHGNGWPSPYGPFQERTKNGLGLDAQDPDQRSPNNVNYKGADWLRENIELAPNAVVILSHLSYASGNASSGMPIPTREVAIQRVDNFANGFLAIGAQVVWALGWQPGADVVKALHTEDATMDAVFMTRYRDPANPLNGWIGQNPGYYVSERTPGATVHIDPHAQYGYLRGITGNLEFTTSQWRDASSAPEDTTPPVISDVSATQSSATLATTGSAEPVFTPNGDGISDTIPITYTLSENAFVEMEFRRNDNVLRQFSRWSLKGPGSISWDGRREDGVFVGDGLVKVVLTPVDRAGNRGEPGEVVVRTLNAMKAPRVSPPLFWPADGDALSRRAELKARLTQPVTASWLILRNGTVIRHGIDEVDYDTKVVRWVWNGRDDAGDLVPKGKYTARIQVTRPKGTYAHDVLIRLMPWRLIAPRWRIKRGQTMVLRFQSAEPLQRKPVVTANPPGVDKYPLRVTKVGENTWKARLYLKKGTRRGKVRVKVLGTDTGGARHESLFKLKVQ